MPMPTPIRTFRLPLAPQPAPSPTSLSNDLLPARRGFLKGLAASMALAGMAGCSKRPKETIVPYVNQPEQMVPGEPLFFATTLTLGGYGRGVIVTSREGRPIKIEGNPDHPASLGAADPFMQAAVLDLYDPARSKLVTRGGEVNTFGNFVEALRAAMLEPNAGAGLRVLTGNIGSPTVLRLIDAVLQKYPGAQWHAYEPVDRLQTRTGAAMAFGRVAEPIYKTNNADVIVAIDSDFFTDEPASIAYARGFAGNRAPSATKPTMSRLYSVESMFSLTGTRADHRLALRPSEVASFVFALAGELGAGELGTGELGAGEATAFTRPDFLKAVAEDLKANQRRSLVIVGERQSPEVHAAAHRINHALGNFGNTLDLVDPISKGVGSGAYSLADLTDDMQAGRVTTLLILGGNPARTALAGTPFSDALTQLSTTPGDDGKPKKFVAHLGHYADETAYRCQWHVPAQHELESWSDARCHDGTASIVQPLIAPLFDGHSDIEVLNALLGDDLVTAYESTRATWRKVFGDRFDTEWKSALERGVILGPVQPIQQPLTLSSETLQAAKTATESASADATVEIVFVPDASVWDGQFFHNAWLQELPRPLTKVCWGNAALIAPDTAKQFGVVDGDIVRLTSGERSIEIQSLVLPGLPAGVVTLHLGYGKHLLTNTPIVPSGGPGDDSFGTDVYPLRSHPHTLAAVTLLKTNRSKIIVRTHGHHAMASHKGDDASVLPMLTPAVIATPDMPEADLKLHNRKIIRTATLDQFKKKPNFAGGWMMKRFSLFIRPGITAAIRSGG